MYHSLTLGSGSRSVNTWKDWHIVPDERPTISPPKPKSTYVEIPGMDGSLDYTEALGDLKYELREGSWSFYVMNDYGQEGYDFESWNKLYSEILETIHGRYLQIWSEDDPEYVYYGRLELDTWDPEKDYSKITISYKIDPYKYKAIVHDDGTVERDVINSTAGFDWLWDELFDNEIYYGKFDVDEKKVRTMYWDGRNADPGVDTLELSVSVTSKMYAIFNEQRIDLPVGRNKYSGIKLNPGDNIVTFYGNGQVTIDYDKEGTSL